MPLSTSHLQSTVFRAFSALELCLLCLKRWGGQSQYCVREINFCCQRITGLAQTEESATVMSRIVTASDSAIETNNLIWRESNKLSSFSIEIDNPDRQEMVTSSLTDGIYVDLPDCNIPESNQNRFTFLSGQ